VDFKIIKERKRVNNSRIFDSCSTNHRSGGRSSNRTQNASGQHSQQCSRQNNRHNRQWLLKDDSGFVVIEFLLVSLILIFLTYSVIEYWLVMTQHQQASHLVNKYLERMSLEGRLSLTDEASLIMDYQNIGLEIESIEAVRESEGNARVLRNPRDLESSALSLKVTTKPLVEPIWIAGLIGGNKGGTFNIVVGGEVVSERIDP
jgi:hypothetical protein